MNWPITLMNLHAGLYPGFESDNMTGFTHRGQPTSMHIQLSMSLLYISMERLSFVKLYKIKLLILLHMFNMLCFSFLCVFKMFKLYHFCFFNLNFNLCIYSPGQQKFSCIHKIKACARLSSKSNQLQVLLAMWRFGRKGGIEVILSGS